MPLSKYTAKGKPRGKKEQVSISVEGPARTKEDLQKHLEAQGYSQIEIPDQDGLIESAPQQ